MKDRRDTLWNVAVIALAVVFVLPRSACGETIPPELLREDFQIMRHALEEAHGGIYRYTSKADMDRTFDRAYKSIDRPMTDLEFWWLVAPVVAHIKCGHTFIWFPTNVQAELATTVLRFPLRTKVIHDRVHPRSAVPAGAQKANSYVQPSTFDILAGASPASARDGWAE